MSAEKKQRLDDEDNANDVVMHDNPYVPSLKRESRQEHHHHGPATTRQRVMPFYDEGFSDALKGHTTMSDDVQYLRGYRAGVEEFKLTAHAQGRAVYANLRGMDEEMKMIWIEHFISGLEWSQN